MTNKKIPEPIVKREGASSTNRKSIEQSNTEQEFFEKLNESKGKSTLLHHKLYRLGITILFFICIAATGYLVFIIGQLIYHYKTYLIQDYNRLAVFLKDLWKVLFGAAVIITINMFSSLIRCKREESNQ